MYCELTDKELKDSYVEYTLLYDTIASRISIDENEDDLINVSATNDDSEIVKKVMYKWNCSVSDYVSWE